jgi:hypothetical protein
MTNKLEFEMVYESDRFSVKRAMIPQGYLYVTEKRGGGEASSICTTFVPASRRRDDITSPPPANDLDIPGEHLAEALN